jgi:hypothetical protein
VNNSDICVRLGKRIRALRKWTQVYMAENVGIDRSLISRGKRKSVFAIYNCGYHFRNDDL